MTMPNVVRGYLRWFELKRLKSAFGPVRAPLLRRLRKRPSLRSSLHGLPPSSFSEWMAQSALARGMEKRPVKNPGIDDEDEYNVA
jgi:hypothetical protein